ncbi:hypothetical protein PHMEG_00018024 [Phytophthora megakarya]|uniref:RanBP2-type domain-containing protein n=1 Tax=Phytophthora megakarya TaxID=4795 RepID=A0A225VV24_9STRA|nr:hypothetical protein PHMEG_00018024 [Phytophthora megakarya]
MRKPRPSRLLTGARRDAATRNAYSAAVAEKILSTLNKVQTPLEREAQKPTPSTSVSWAKYHLSLTDGEKNLENGMEIDSDDVAPPTGTIPRVAFPQSTQKPASLSFGSTSNIQTPAKSTISSSNDLTPVFSPQAVSMTPVKPKFETIGEFKFTLPIRMKGATQLDADEEDTRVQFIFSPPPSLREPPVKVSSQKSAAKINGGAAPFDFMPASPKTITTEWTSKPLKIKEPEKPKVVSQPAPVKETEKPSTIAAPASSPNGAVNPLARFMQLKPGQWKCPGCSVLNEATSAKCPCCETANPGGASADKPVVAQKSSAGSITSGGFSFGAPATETKKNDEKPAVGSITSGGFSFGAPATDAKKNDEKPAVGSITSGGFSFGAPATDAKKNDEKPAAGSITSGGFSFGASTTDAKKDAEKPAAGSITSSGFSFGAPATDAKKDAGKPPSAGFSFGAPAAETKKDADKPSTGISSGGFSFTAPAPSADKQPVGGFSFGAAATDDKSETSASNAPISFGFSAPTATSSTPAATAKIASVPSFSFALTKENRYGAKLNNNVVDNSKAAFLVGNPGEPLGLNVPIFSEPAHAIRRDKKNTALSKHKKWLHDLQKERARLQAALAEDEEAAYRRRERFSQREAKLREAVRSNNDNEDIEEDAAMEKKNLNRPMWALTKATAEEKLEHLEDAEADHLIDFANNLDIDQFMDDVEIKARVAQVDQQLEQVQSIVDHEDAEEMRYEREQERLEELANGGEAYNGNDLSRIGWDRAEGKNDDDVISVANTVLSECKSIRSVHSVRSVAAITKRVEAKLLSAPSEAGSAPPAPRIVTVDEEEGARMQIKTLPSNLPYIHRNPAI